MRDRFTPLGEGTSLGTVPSIRVSGCSAVSKTRVPKRPPPVVWDEGPTSVGVEPNNHPLMGGALAEFTRFMDAP